MNAAVLDCGRKALAEGFDLTAYSAVQMAGDIADLMQVLPWDERNLFGVSYGTRVALVTMRDRPEGIRSVILDSALPIAGRDFDHATAHFAGAPDRLFADCAADPACRQTYPDLEAAIYAAIARLDDEPMIVPVDDTELYLGVNFLDFYGTLCYDEGTFASRTEFDRVSALSALGYELEYCQDWPAETATLEEIEPAPSAIPTLILHGEYDHQTPPAFGKELASRLEGSYLHVFASTGHYVSISDDCAQDMILDFLDDPSTPPSASCLDERPRRRFATDVYVTGGVIGLMMGALSPPHFGHLTVTGLVLLSLLSAVIAWPVTAVVRRIRGPGDGRRPSRPARWIAGAVAGAGLLFVAGLAWVVTDTVTRMSALLVFGVPSVARPLFLLPLLALPLAVLNLVLVAREWRRREWHWAWRLHYSVVAVGGAGFVV